MEFGDSLEDMYLNYLQRQEEEKKKESEVKETLPQKDLFVPYLRTNGFCWNSRGQMAYFSYQKYKFQHFVQKPNRKKLYKLEEINSVQKLIT